MKKLLAFIFLATLGTMYHGVLNAQPQRIVSYTISCLGKSEICAEWHWPGSNVWRRIGGIRIYEDPYPHEFARQCPDGSPIKNNIFLFDPGSSTTGVGYIGCKACIDEENNKHIVETNEQTRVFTDHQAWVDAQQAIGPLE